MPNLTRYTHPMLSALSAYAIGVAALTLAEMRDHPARFLLKPALALGFVALAVSTVISPAFGDALNTVGVRNQYGQIIIAALAACALGDILLLRRGTGAAFIAGMAAFALGHLIYSFAFALHTESTGIIGALLIGVTITVATLMARDQPKTLRWAVTIYGGIIGLMLAFAYGSGTWLLLPAVAFALSDIFVAQNRLSTPKDWHPIAITPLYFSAQAAFALSPAYLFA
jgi:alkenylglycerophosphocholine/alkenylglycerophosphoethanolamine hydrolase